MGEAISTSEGITGNRYIGEMNTTVDNSCSPKDMTGNGFGRTTRSLSGGTDQAGKLLLGQRGLFRTNP
ncbi:MAG: hypothetical protein MZU95_06505 [Desulfomicrobium escambiense]|nr:hypothetical protein [Desulfomicrobium escambiense]